MSNRAELEGLVHSKLKTMLLVWFSEHEAFSLLAVLYKGKSESLRTELLDLLVEYDKLVRDIVDAVESKIRPFAVATVDDIFQHPMTKTGTSRKRVLRERAYRVLNKMAKELEVEQRKSSTKKKIAELTAQLKILKSSLAEMDKPRRKK